MKPFYRDPITLSTSVRVSHDSTHLLVSPGTIKMKDGLIASLDPELTWKYRVRANLGNVDKNVSKPIEKNTVATVAKPY